MAKKKETEAAAISATIKVKAPEGQNVSMRIGAERYEIVAGFMNMPENVFEAHAETLGLKKG